MNELRKLNLSNRLTISKYNYIHIGLVEAELHKGALKAGNNISQLSPKWRTVFVYSIAEKICGLNWVNYKIMKK